MVLLCVFLNLIASSYVAGAWLFSSRSNDDCYRYASSRFFNNNEQQQRQRQRQQQSQWRWSHHRSHLSMISKQQLGTFEVLEDSELDVPNQSDRKVMLLDYTTEDDDDDDDDEDDVSIDSSLVEFQTAWDWQKELMERHFTRLAAEHQQQQQQQDVTNTRSQLSTSFLDPSAVNNVGVDTVIMLQHQPVYTLGTGSDEKFVLAGDGSSGSSSSSNDDEVHPTVPTVRMDRGGEVTYHGPGQLTVYPVLDLRNYKQDIHWYMRALEEATILALSKCGINRTMIERQDDVTGVWVSNHKVAAVGIKCRKWVTMHGVAVNVEQCSLDNFDGIVPCGLEGRKVGCINQFLKANGLPELTVHQFSNVMAEALEDIFRISLVRES